MFCIERRQLELRDEIQRVKARKELREIEKEQMEEMKTMMAREMEKEMNANWDQKEEEFHREQVLAISCLPLCQYLNCKIYRRESGLRSASKRGGRRRAACSLIICSFL